jgi:tetratricopeptide (TPR) repeat protein
MRDRRGTAATLNQLGNLALLQDDVPRAVTLLKQSLALHQQLADKRGVAATLKNLAIAARAQADYELARGYYEGSAAVYAELGDRRNMTDCRDRLAELTLDVESAVVYPRADRAIT